jgi:hypothetical protein
MADNATNYKLISESECQYLINSLLSHSLTLADVRLCLASRLLQYKDMDAPTDKAKRRSIHRYSLNRCRAILDNFRRNRGRSRRHRVPDKALCYLVDSATLSDTLTLLYAIPRQLRDKQYLRLHQRRAAKELNQHYNSINNSVRRLIKLGILSPLPLPTNHPSNIIHHGKAFTLDCDTLCNNL